LPLPALSRAPFADEEAASEARSRAPALAEPFVAEPFLDLERELPCALPRVRLAEPVAADAPRLALEPLALDVFALDEPVDFDCEPERRAAAVADDAREPFPSPPLLPARDAPRAEPEAGALPFDCGAVLRDVVPLRCVAGAIS
jgi:hypothetical protein